MSTATLQKLKNELKRELKQELLREFITPILRESKDAEGEYRKEFIRKVLKSEKGSLKHRFNSKTFLKMLS
ncbi:MAG: hypothetical protein A3B92_00100 [Candidatus Harrisonbacteria bacterium RIFCSPHIGHO2_02_FULL_42_16]|uniref:Uncharacterized protein n=1 Tax=Candidatus Harrisonbacteria bacterium RIFCSPHIGHO2_02_FULL_42_16 TaxID=1798404 RepID=A0A1G1ZJL4_9BACT|nr:MAG: hypothetical protein A3B92_00100 [Candidatus Harrisonbacteria bacterium RIFCSPHIGHO2_02_FULL_42_16]